jgi:hypothetical protein
MGMYDTVYIHDNRMKCKNGHDMSGQDFQTKDLTNTLSTWVLKKGRLKLEQHNDEVWEPVAKSGVIRVYTTCDNCDRTRDNNGVLELNNWAQFFITIKDGAVVNIQMDKEND